MFDGDNWRPGQPATVFSIQVGKLAPLGPNAVPSGIAKTPVSGPVAVGPFGLDGDQQADLNVHGGVDKALYVYGAERYNDWMALLPEHAAHFVAGGMGENLTLRGLDETSVYLGDVMLIGTTTIQVSQPRQPCGKLGMHFNDIRVPREMRRTLYSGWYCRVLTPGMMRQGDAVHLLERPNPDWPVMRFYRLLATRGATVSDVATLAEMPGLAEEWRTMARREHAGSRR